MARAIVMRAPGGPEVLKVEDVDVGRPGPGEARLRQTAVGVNFHDIYVRTGLYKTLPLPGIPGLEAVGVVEAIGPGVEQVKVGDRVGCLTATYGSYAEARLVDAGLLIKLPDSLDDCTAAATLLRGLTARMLVHHVHKVGSGQTVLVHAASGGVGRLLCQWAHYLGATVIGTVGSEEKACSARENGCDHVILHRTENFVERVQAITGGRGVDVAYDSVGKDTFMGSMTCLARLGHMVNFGQASGPVDPIPMALLFQKSNSVGRSRVSNALSRASKSARSCQETNVRNHRSSRLAIFHVPLRATDVFEAVLVDRAGRDDAFSERVEQRSRHLVAAPAIRDVVEKIGSRYPLLEHPRRRSTTRGCRTGERPDRDQGASGRPPGHAQGGA